MAQVSYVTDVSGVEGMRPAGPGGEQPPGAQPQGPPSETGPQGEKSEKTLAQLKQQIKNVAAQLGYTHKEGQPGQPVPMATEQGQHVAPKVGDEVKPEDSDELGDFLSM